MEDERIYWFGNVPYKQIKVKGGWTTKERIKPSSASIQKTKQ